jgi:hypothetical protein
MESEQGEFTDDELGELREDYAAWLQQRAVRRHKDWLRGLIVGLLVWPVLAFLLWVCGH